MAIFRVPKITSQNRSQLLLGRSEIVYDTDRNSFYGGDGGTVGGFEIGKNVGLKIKTESFLLNQENIDNKSIVLSKEPNNSSDIVFFPEGGIAQRNNIDFNVSTNVLSWDGFGLDGFLEVDDVVNITYYYY
jgi:hypothetical protein